MFRHNRHNSIVKVNNLFCGVFGQKENKIGGTSCGSGMSQGNSDNIFHAIKLPILLTTWLKGVYVKLFTTKNHEI